LGCILSGSSISSTYPANGILSTINTPTSGVWLFYWNILLYYTTLPTLVFVGISGLGSGTGYAIQGSNNNGLIFNNMFIITATLTSYDLYVSTTGGSGYSLNSSQSYFRAIRIA
jgi:hypothetical protein